MVRCNGWPVGVCNWSLRMDMEQVAQAMKKIGLDHVHLSIAPVLEKSGETFLDKVKQQQWTISSTMIDFPQEDYSTLEKIKVTGGIIPEEYWPVNQERVLQAIAATADLGVKYLSTHFGFIDHRDKAGLKKFYQRVRKLADAAAKKNVMLLMETGQESAADLRRVLEELNHPAIGVNFDPANMILYNMGDPVAAVGVLAPWIKHIHAKDALYTKQPGSWGQEVPWGDGQVNTDAFLRALKQAAYKGVLAIEREQGENRFEDIKLAAERLSTYRG